MNLNNQLTNYNNVKFDKKSRVEYLTSWAFVQLSKTPLKSQIPSKKVIFEAKKSLHRYRNVDNVFRL